MRIISIILVFSLFLFGIIHLNSSLKSQAPVSEDTNEILQNAVMRDLEGREVRLQDFLGKTVLIDIWETWCTPCLLSFPTLQKLMDDYPDDFVVLAVSPAFMDSEEQVRNFIQNHSYDFVFVFGEELSRDLRVTSIPFKLYVSPEGELVTTVLGSQGPEQDYNKAKEIIEQFL